MGIKQSVGKKGEEAAQAFLKNKGYKIEATNYRTSAGEIDIIARDKSALVFIEVKTRTTQTFGLPCEAVGYKKQVKIRRVALQYLAERPFGSGPVRFDVISVLVCAPNHCRIDHIVNAF